MVGQDHQWQRGALVAVVVVLLQLQLQLWLLLLVLDDSYKLLLLPATATTISKGGIRIDTIIP